jgi:hypothetical protein
MFWENSDTLESWEQFLFGCNSRCICMRDSCACYCVVVYIMVFIIPWFIPIMLWSTGLRDLFLPQTWPNAWCFWLGVACFALVIHIGLVLVYQCVCCRLHKPLPWWAMIYAVLSYLSFFTMYLLLVGLGQINYAIFPSLCETMWCGQLIGWGFLNFCILLALSSFCVWIFVKVSRKIDSSS